MIYANDYKTILKDLISQRPRGEIARIAGHLNVASTLLSQVLSGRRHLTLEQSNAIANYFGFAHLEKDYFLAMVHKDRTQDQELKKYWEQKLEEIRSSTQTIKEKVKAQTELEDHIKAKFYSSYLFSAIRLFTSIGRGKTLSEICEKFKITRQKAQEIINFLLENNLVINTNGFYQMGVQSTHISKESDYVYRHHTNWRMKSLSRLDEIKENEISFTCPCSLDKETFLELKKDILDLIEDAVKKTRNAPANELACLNIDLFYVDN